MNSNSSSFGGRSLLTRAPSGDATRLEQVRAHLRKEVGDAGRPHSGHPSALLTAPVKARLPSGQDMAPRSLHCTRAVRGHERYQTQTPVYLQPPCSLIHTRAPQDSQPGTAYIHVHTGGHVVGHTLLHVDTCSCLVGCPR